MYITSLLVAVTRSSTYLKDEFSLEGIRALCRPGTALLLKGIYPLAIIEGAYIHLKYMGLGLEVEERTSDLEEQRATEQLVEEQHSL